MMEVISTRRYEARPPIALTTLNTSPGSLTEDENGIATVKEEEWETRKKKEITTTRQIETRVKRQVVLEDGEVVVDSGPVVTTNTTEDVEQQEHTTHERKTAGDEPKEIEWSLGERSLNGNSGPGTILQKESNETVVRSREEIEERLETEDRQQLGDISDEAYLRAIHNNRGDLRVALAESSKQLIPLTGPRVVQHTTKSSKVIDTENTLEKSQVQVDGRIITEAKRTVQHEEIKDDDVPDGQLDDDDDEPKEVKKESSQRFLKEKDEEVVDYVSGGERVAREMRYVSENTEGERIGDWPPAKPTMRTARLHKHAGLASESVPMNRKDALTKKPLDLEEEDEARKVETSKWLESHFGSESRSSHGSVDLDTAPVPTGTNTSFINVTMKSLPISSLRDRDNGWEREQQSNAYSPEHHSKRADRRDSNSSAGYFHGISEWSERYQNQNQNQREKTSQIQSNGSAPMNGAPRNGEGDSGRNANDWGYSNSFTSVRQQHQESRSKIESQDVPHRPSPPLRRHARQQLQVKQEKAQAAARNPSPVNVVQRTWESRNRAIDKEQEHVGSILKSSSGSRSASPTKSSQNTETPSRSSNSRTSKPSSQTKYKIGESFRKLVGKLRSASSERKNKRNTASSVTQTDDTSTYLQYNVIDKNIPLMTDHDCENRPPDRPARSLGPVKSQYQQPTEGPPVQRYYLGEDPFGGSIYGREKGYASSKPSGRRHQSARPEHDQRDNSMGRLNKSTSRLANEYERNEQFRSTQTLPRKLHSQPRQVTTSSSTLNRNNRRIERSVAPPSTMHANNRQYGSMINISIKNTVTSAKAATNSPQVPIKPERTYKSSLLRSKSFNVEANRNGTDPSGPYKSNLQLNRLDETPPLKSPGILASISRSNRDLFKATKYEY